MGGKALYLPLTQVEASAVKSAMAHMLTDLSILGQAHSLIALQPLTPSRIEKLSMCGIAALYNAVLTSIAASVLSMCQASGGSQKQQPATAATTSQGSANNSNVSTGAKDHDDFEEQACTIVNKALEIYTSIGEMFKASARMHVYQNHLCYGSWLLISGIQGAMGASGSSSSSSSSSGSSSGKSAASTAESNVTPSTPIARVNLFKVQQGFGELNAAIANHSIKLLSELIDDLKIESACGSTSSTGTITCLDVEPAQFDILQNYTALQRIVRVLNTATLHQLFTFLATVAYRKACTLKRASAKDRTECEPISYSDSTTYFNDSLSCSDNSEEDDSESYLGHWFKETLSPETHDDNANACTQDRSGEQKSALVPRLDEPHEYLDLAADIFCFLDQFLANRHAYMQRYVKAGVSDQQMLLMANIIKDFDRDVMRQEAGGNSSGAGGGGDSNCSNWQSAMIRFSGAAGRYIHNLISTSLLSEQLQSNLLQHLAISPWSTDTNSWPLQVYPSTLSVLVQILLLKPTQEKEAACLSVWHRLINTLVEGVCSSANASDTDYEDLNIEHAQLLLFLFHSLNLMQKKSILLLTAGGVIRCADVCRGISAERPVRNSQMMLLSRLLLFLEYLMKHLYNAPPELLDQVRWNLFSVSTMPDTQKITDLLNSRTKLTSYCRQDIEERFRNSTVGDLNSSRFNFKFIIIAN